MFNNFLCAEALITTIVVVDILFVLVAIGLFVWYFIHTKRKNNNSNPVNTKSVTKVDDETYVIEHENGEPEKVVYENDNEVVHFVNQISDINEEVNNELNANTVVVNHEVEYPVKKIVAKEEIENYVMIDGQKKQKTDVEVAKTVNRGTNAFKNATDFVNVINSEQKSEALSSKKVTKKK